MNMYSIPDKFDTHVSITMYCIDAFGSHLNSQSPKTPIKLKQKPVKLVGAGKNIKIFTMQCTLYKRKKNKIS